MGCFLTSQYGEIFQEIDGWFWPTSDLGAWDCYNEMLARGQYDQAKEMKGAIDRAQEQRDEMDYETLRQFG